MSRAWEKGGDTRWQRFRVGILNRDQWLCLIKDRGCTDKATQVDHIVPLAMGGEKYDPLNCRAACQPCNARRERASTQYEPPHKTITQW